MAKKIEFDIDARDGIKRGVDALANAREKVNTRFAYYYDSLPEIMAEIDTYALHIESAQVRNYTTWETLGVRVWPNPVWFETYQEEVDQLKNWITDRMNWLNTEL
jgi:hypothetical protein